MPDARIRHPRIQFSLRALFILTLFAALLATVASWMRGVVIPGSVLAAIAIGAFIGLTTTLIAKHVQLSFLLGALLIGLVCANGFWIPANYLAYCGGVIAGAVVAWKGLDVLNAMFRLCGVMVSEADRPMFWWLKRKK